LQQLASGYVIPCNTTGYHRDSDFCSLWQLCTTYTMLKDAPSYTIQFISRHSSCLH